MERRNIVRTITLAAIVATMLTAMPADTSAATRVYVRIAPPAPVVETVVAAPRAGYVWRPGYYRWTGSAYAWVGGRYVAPPRPHAVWVPGHWALAPRGWFWIGGTWR